MQKLTTKDLLLIANFRTKTDTPMTCKINFIIKTIDNLVYLTFDLSIKSLSRSLYSNPNYLLGEAISITLKIRLNFFYKLNQINFENYYDTETKQEIIHAKY